MDWVSILCRLILKALILHGLVIRRTAGKGTRVGAGTGDVCLECLGNYTAEEMREALVFLVIIMVLFILVCSCQMYQRAKWELTGNKGRRPMPMAPYGRDLRNHSIA